MQFRCWGWLVVEAHGSFLTAPCQFWVLMTAWILFKCSTSGIKILVTKIPTLCRDFKQLSVFNNEAAHRYHQDEFITGQKLQTSQWRFYRIFFFLLRSGLKLGLKIQLGSYLIHLPALYCVWEYYRTCKDVRYTLVPSFKLTVSPIFCLPFILIGIIWVV